ncbi:MAG TPA: hypothetical protein VK120_07245 [Sporosarcina sp.]|nr:hypothetical protein [Sporosarcina sp.]
MRLLLSACLLFIVIHIVRIDLESGTIPTVTHASGEQNCENETSELVVTSLHDDTIESLFALYPDQHMTFMERLQLFYKLNPHLQNQQVIGGLEIVLPITTSLCQNE